MEAFGIAEGVVGTLLPQKQARRKRGKIRGTMNGSEQSRGDSGEGALSAFPAAGRVLGVIT